MSRQKFLTVEEALAAIEGPEFGEGELNVVIALPDVTVISDKEGIDQGRATVYRNGPQRIRIVMLRARP